MKYLALLLLLIAPPTEAVVRTLSGDCSIPRRFTPSENTPFDLDNCTLRDGDDIATLLKDIAARWGDVYVRAPSTTLTVTYTDTAEFGPSGLGADEFVFLDDQESGNKLTIQHVAVSEDAVMWRMTNLDHIVIGSSNLGITFKGTHPGLGQGKPCSGTRESCTVLDNVGLIAINLSDGSNPALLDIRANFWKTWGSGTYVTGGANGSDGNSTANRWQQANFAGLHVGAGIYVNSGVMSVWSDPDRTVMMDPWIRSAGWDGGVAGTSGAISYGCMDNARAQFRNGTGIGFQYTRNVTGGVTLVYGTLGASMFVPKYIGSAGAPFLVRLQNWGHSGPTAITGLPAGVRIRSGYADGVAKYDPAPTFGLTAPFRFMRYHVLPSQYGNGTWNFSISSGCAVGNATSNSSGVAGPWIFRAEASRDGQAGQYVTFGFDITLQNTERWQPMTDPGAGAAAPWSADTGGSGQDNAPGPTDPDRTYGHVIRAASDSDVPAIRLLDSSTATGPGAFNSIQITRAPIDQGGYINPINNTITNTHVSGVIVAGQDSVNTVVSNVEFKGTARTIMTIGTGADVTVTGLCAPNNSTITVASGGTLVYEGRTYTADHTIAPAANNCSIDPNGLPNPPGAT